ncbi:unnamed protein product [Fraxinus pennsylvanica]|uniref:Uncharacterized protein n=1 Tax=Fraxinus pennsylvanica TaxID=56036 RepID=A0AAD2ECU7_9LAMI|nr:unnamed protein product [Fraxinus pennsylvanica]
MSDGDSAGTAIRSIKKKSEKLLVSYRSRLRTCKRSKTKLWWRTSLVKFNLGRLWRVSPNILFSSYAKINSSEARSNKRLFWDAFSRRGSRRRTDSRAIALSSDDSNHLMSDDKCLLDISGDFDGVGGDFRSYWSRTQGVNERWHSNSEVTFWITHLYLFEGSLEISGKDFVVVLIQVITELQFVLYTNAEESGTSVGLS